MRTPIALLLTPVVLLSGCEAPVEAPLPPLVSAATLAGDAVAADPAALAWTIEPLPFPLETLSGPSALAMYGSGPGVLALYDGTAWHDLSTGDPFWQQPWEPALYRIWAPTRDVVYGFPHCGKVVKRARETWSVIGPSWQGGLAEPVDDEPLCWFYWALWGIDETEVWLVGEYGQAARYDGTAWTDVSPGPFTVFTDELQDIWGSSGSDIFVVGGDFWGNFRSTILHYDGAGWTIMVDSKTAATPYLTAVWGASPSDVFAVGFGGTILHYDGVAWTQMESGTTAHLNSIGGTSGSNVYVAGSGGLLHYDGTSWAPVALATAGSLPLQSVRVVPRGDVFALGAGVLVKGTPGG